jgi:acyl-CoA thioester hydrolase
MEFFRALGFADEVASNALDVQLVKQTTTWKAPARNNDVLEIRIAAKALGTTSFTIEAQFRIAGAAQVVCEIETVYVRVDHDTLKKQPPAICLASRSSARPRRPSRSCRILR